MALLPLLHLAVEALAQLPDELALRPGQPLIIGVNHQHALGLPAFALDVLGRLSVAAKASGRPPLSTPDPKCIGGPG